MIKKFYYAITGDPNEKVLKRYRPIVEQINGLEKTFEKKSNDELRGLTIGFQQRILQATTDLPRAAGRSREGIPRCAGHR